MTWSEVTVAITAALLVTVWLVWVQASRLDRLHRKVGSSRAALDNQLVRRASAAAELAASGLMDPVSSVLVGEAAWRALLAGSVDADAPVGGLDVHVPLGDAEHAERDLAESELSATVRAALEEPDEVAALRAEPYGAELLDALQAAWYRVTLARRFHNEAVAQTRRVRRKVVVRVLRLQGRAPLPATVEIDDAMPDALGEHR
ncbi:hypothetical protein Q6348_11530 [Isoptericola sp. b441]|uniref:NUDIX hydrolase n=1 Tax=Actinotalea lenta TaxID=3064654 RepID=A0ABT9DBY9_9CELL|nr:MULTISPECIES: hypothetical protein [unclassified Isoptericola]MDO8107829.1 hypothetical protein [Isoptericola sp. b441]MDO8120500.1 hypothetical protein [Isoptericola sp. b490]